MPPKINLNSAIGHFASESDSMCSVQALWTETKAISSIRLRVKIAVLENRKINVFDGNYADYLRVTGHA
ncbi:hypothetical protein [Hominenteromicrobium sp.]|uniref:hypothetical protein n=1 Tax=Hominenteromicrobium sp. TaxID=3073581 RepID=UPI003A95862B